MTQEPYKVYVQTDGENRVISINSSAFVGGEGWVQIDSGFGDKYHHAQGNYFTQPLYDDRGICRYKLVNGRPVERTQEEIDADYTPMEIKPTTEQRVDMLEVTTDDIILMMADLIGGN